MKTSTRARWPIHARISRGRILRDDIKYSDRLTPAQIATIPCEKVYQYLREKSWNYKDFMKWLNSFSEEVDDE